MRDYFGNFEVHVTVAVTGSLDTFRHWCEAERCKCVWIVLARGVEVQHPMATWRRSGTVLPDVLAEAKQRVEALQRGGFVVVRLKIEADISNDQVPEADDDARLEPASCYFEHHVKLRRDVNVGCESLMQVSLSHSAHLSHNAWRQPIEGVEERFVTLRSHGVGHRTSAQQLKGLLTALKSVGELITEVESEYAVYDSNLALDDGWLPHRGDVTLRDV